MEINIWTDGSCDHHDDRRPGGWAFIVIIEGEEYPGDGGTLRTTNNQMELNAILEAMWEVEKLNIDEKEKLIFHVDSQWSINCLTKEWNCVTRDKKTGKMGGHVQWLHDIWSKISHRPVEFVKEDESAVLFKRVDKMAKAQMEWARANLR